MRLGPPVHLGAAAVVDLAERAAQLSPGQWSLAFLRAAYPCATDDTLLALPVGSRDRHVIAARMQMLGGEICSQPVCAACGEVFELSLWPEDVGLGPGDVEAEPGYRPVQCCGRQVELRPVSLGDLLAIEAIADPRAAAQELGQRVIRNPQEVPPLTGDLSQALEALDPAADIWLSSACPECGAEHKVTFEPVSFVAQEMNLRARQILHEVVEIARVFHWSEREILALSDSRRAWYVAEALA